MYFSPVQLGLANHSCSDELLVREVSFVIVNEESLKSKHGILHNKHPQIMYGDIYQNL